MVKCTGKDVEWGFRSSGCDAELLFSRFERTSVGFLHCWRWKHSDPFKRRETLTQLTASLTAAPKPQQHRCPNIRFCTAPKMWIQIQSTVCTRLQAHYSCSCGYLA